PPTHTHTVVNFNIQHDSKTQTYRGLVPFYAPRSPGTFVFRLFFDTATDSRFQLATSQTMYVEVQGRDLEPNLRFTLSQFKAKKTSLAALHQLGQVMQGLRVGGGGEGSGRAAWGCFCESRKVLQNVDKEVKEKETELKNLESTTYDSDDEITSAGRKEKRATLESLYRKKRDVEVALAHVVTYAVRNPSARSVFREDQWEVIRKEYERWCPLSEKFCGEEVKLLEYQKEVFGFEPRLILGKGGVGIEKLSKQVRENMQERAPGKGFAEGREEIRRRLQAVVDSCDEFPKGTELKIFGSSANGFGSPNSDLDMCLALPPGQPLKDGVEAMGALAEDLEKAGMVEVVARLTARIPIIMFEDGVTKMECDISLHNPLAVKNTHLLNAYSTCDERVRQLAYTIKRWSKARDLNNPSAGTLSSYGWIMMLLHFLQSTGSKESPPVLPDLQKIGSEWTGEPAKIYEMGRCTGREMLKHPTTANVNVNVYFYNDRDKNGRVKHIPVLSAKNKIEVGYLLAGFFRYYAFQFDFRRFVVSLYTGGRLMEKDMMGEVHCWPVHVGLAIQDPFETFYNVGHVVKTAQFHRIKRECARAFSLIADAGSDGGPDIENLLDMVCEEVAVEE
ncbi:hypothetical protein TrLO_g7070, partial [Triparma laevis f. longispina]